MLQQIIDRRLSGKNKSIANRERFLHRFRDHIKRAVADAVRDRSIQDIGDGKSVTIPRKDVSEPVFGHGPGGNREIVHAGNDQYIVGDRIARPTSRNSQGGGSASNDGNGEDDFVFQLTREEFMHYFFDDLELPRLLETQLTEVPSSKNVRAGIAIDGTPNRIDIVRSLRSALGRRIAIASPLAGQLRALEKQRDDTSEELPEPEAQALNRQILQLRERLRRIPFLDPFDLRYINHTRQPQPSSRAVMFCLMDVSGSMDEQRKDLAKRFFILLYLFLSRNYEHTEVVFIRHHTRADEVDENTFFHTRESGGTVVSSALELMKKIIELRYPPSGWNIYAAQASDGDNWNDDSPKCEALLANDILPCCRYFAYIQVAVDEQNLWQSYEKLAAMHAHFAIKKVMSASEIYPVFRELFEKQHGQG